MALHEEGSMAEESKSVSKAAALREKGEGNQTVMDKLVNDVVQPALLPMIEKGYMPDRVVRLGMRKLLASTINTVTFHGDQEQQADYIDAFVQDLKTRGIAEQTDASAEQHYEVPADFFIKKMGPQMKYSCCQYPDAKTTLAEAEDHALALFCERAELAALPDGADVLDLGCGWGSLSLYIGKHFPNLKVIGVSHSNSQREFIMARAKEHGLSNVEIRTCDVNDLDLPEASFDRICSIEMLEHVKNYWMLFKNMSKWLKDDGKVMVHVFCHRDVPYHFQDGWMSDNFFSGGTMPSYDLFLFINDHLRVDRRWAINGVHYSRTLEHWLENLDANRGDLIKFFKEGYGDKASEKYQAWRLFCMACSELFKYDNGRDGPGNEWFVAHYRFVKVSNKAAVSVP
ncbi:Pavine N-methyltransferase [Hondaea fermentalgiana]|uniref:Pavine N-methyltransferase n=1 Tax=Hondaea fermentalgiana TaxID=2315210 RepID=A0A2R5FZG2_9STRA|nr:Pavine N-methyltransferase [Hondaea fermentalgiana]|eukprot:GBG24147.1 Pavine N-methyltransferase [Hondaea fermentalgiana]